MDTSTNTNRHSSSINDEVSDLSEKVVLVGEPVDSSISIWVGIDESHSLEARGGLNSGKSDGISNKLGIVVLDDRSADNIGTRWEVY